MLLLVKRNEFRETALQYKLVTALRNEYIVRTTIDGCVKAA